MTAHPTPAFTDRQAAAWPEAIAEAQRYVETSTIAEAFDRVQRAIAMLRGGAS